MPGLIDSGADSSMLPLQLADYLGIELSACREDQCLTAAGLTARYVWEEGIEAEVQALRRRIHLDVSFVTGLPALLLGRSDFFAAFRVEIDERGQTFYLEPYE
jgi:hypothetical protein